MLTFSDVAIFLACVAGVFALFFLLPQIPRLVRRTAARLAEDGRQPRAGWRRVIGLGALAASPVYGYAFPLAAFPAALALLQKPLGAWPRRTKPLVWWSIIGIAAMVISARYQGQEMSGNVLHFAAFALFTAAAVKLTSDETSAAQLMGYASVGTALFYVIFRPANTADTFEHLWKYGLGPYVAIIVVWFVCSLGGRIVTPAIALTIVGCVSLFLGFRSHGLVCFVVAVVLLLRGRTKKGEVPVFRTILAGGALYGLSVALPAAIEAGLFGEAVRQRTLEQVGADGPALLAGRVEPPLSIAAISARWLTGWGNLNNIDGDTISHGANMSYQLGLLPEDYMKLWIRADGRVSLHSVLGEAWAEGGILTAVLPLLLIVVFVAAALKAHGPWSAFVLLVCVQGVWDVLFSTWGYNRALTLALSAVLAAWAVTAGKSGAQESELAAPRIKLDRRASRVTPGRAV